MDDMSESPQPATSRPHVLFYGTLVLLFVVGGIAYYVLNRAPSVGAEGTLRAFLDAANAQRFEEAKRYCSPDLSDKAIRSWMVGGFTYQLDEVEGDSTTSANIEAEITKGTQHFILRFGLYNEHNRWVITLMMVTR